jgi:hypothetical protein
MDSPLSVSDTVAHWVRDLRNERGLSTKELAERCAGLGAKQITAQVIYKLEGQRGTATRSPRPVSVDELLVLSLALNVAPVHLLVPPNDSGEPYPVTSTMTEPRHRVRGWVRGLFPLARLPLVGDKRQFFTVVPAEEFDDVQHGRCPACGGRPPREIVRREHS